MLCRSHGQLCFAVAVRCHGCLLHWTALILEAGSIPQVPIAESVPRASVPFQGVRGQFELSGWGLPRLNAANLDIPRLLGPLKKILYLIYLYSLFQYP